MSHLTSRLDVGVHAWTEGGGGAGEGGVGGLGQAGIVLAGVAGHSVLVMVRLVVRFRVVGWLRLVVGRGWVVSWLWNISWSWFVSWLRNVGWNRSWLVGRLWSIDWCGGWDIGGDRFMIDWRGVRCWRVGWRRHRRVLSLSSDLLTDSLDWEAVEGGEVLLAVGVGGHEGQEGEGGQWEPLHVVAV